MNIEVFNHDILGEMHVFGNEQGLWFCYDEVVNCLEVEEVRAKKKYKFLDSDLKQSVECEFNYEGQQQYRFIHEKAVYQFMCLGTSELCLQFQEWVGEIAYELNLLNIRTDYVNSPVDSDYMYIKNYVNTINDQSQAGAMAKEAMKRLDESLNDRFIFDDSKEYRTDFTLKEVWKEPYYRRDLTREEMKEFEEIENGDPWDFDIIERKVRFELEHKNLER